jgi:hypothetical protein
MYFMDGTQVMSRLSDQLYLVNMIDLFLGGHDLSNKTRLGESYEHIQRMKAQMAVTLEPRIKHTQVMCTRVIVTHKLDSSQTEECYVISGCIPVAYNFSSSCSEKKKEIASRTINSKFDLLTSDVFWYVPTHFVSGPFVELFPTIKITDKLVVVAGSVDSDSMIANVRSGAPIYHTDYKKLVKPFNARISLEGVIYDITITDLSNGKEATHCLPSVLEHDEPKSLGIQGLCIQTHTMITIRCDTENYNIFRQAMLRQTYGTTVQQTIRFPPVIKKLAETLHDLLVRSTTEEMFRTNLKKKWSAEFNPLKRGENMSAYIYELLNSLLRDPRNRFDTYSEQIDLMVKFREIERESEKVTQIRCALFGGGPERCADLVECGSFNNSMAGSQSWENMEDPPPINDLLRGTQLMQSIQLGSARPRPKERTAIARPEERSAIARPTRRVVLFNNSMTGSHSWENIDPQNISKLLREGPLLRDRQPGSARPRQKGRTARALPSQVVSFNAMSNSLLNKSGTQRKSNKPRKPQRKYVPEAPSPEASHSNKNDS